MLSLCGRLFRNHSDRKAVEEARRRKLLEGKTVSLQLLSFFTELVAVLHLSVVFLPLGAPLVCEEDLLSVLLMLRALSC